MNFHKKLKIRLITAIVYMVLGVILVGASFCLKADLEMLSSFGTVLLFVGLARLKHYFVITKSEESVRNQEIKETDERNVYVIGRAKSTAFNIFVPLASLAVIVLQMVGPSEVALWMFGAVMALVILYWICYFVIRQRS